MREPQSKPPCRPFLANSGPAGLGPEGLPAPVPAPHHRPEPTPRGALPAPYPVSETHPTHDRLPPPVPALITPPTIPSANRERKLPDHPIVAVHAAFQRN